jgi:hypothetical protein
MSKNFRTSVGNCHVWEADAGTLLLALLSPSPNTLEVLADNLTRLKIITRTGLSLSLSLYICLYLSLSIYL